MTVGLDVSTHDPFGHRGWSFVCGAEREHSGVYKATVLGRFKRRDSVTLPADTESFGTAAEALRHAEQQAMR